MDFQKQKMVRGKRCKGPAGANTLPKQGLLPGTYIRHARENVQLPAWPKILSPIGACRLGGNKEHKLCYTRMALKPGPCRLSEIQFESRLFLSGNQTIN